MASQTSDPGLCTAVRWCDEVAGHAGPHARYVASMILHDRGGRAIAVTVTRTGATRIDRDLEILLNGRGCGLELALSQPEAEQLARALSSG